ncbi:TPA: adenylate/guanylate cyclase domain-containing protein [Candidatus Gastranaerophilales bacterium HUM_20]|nr:cHASE2 domain protein [Clostridium sp. CAG:729]DAB20207.1 MAG TPA: adenylate/guanylate cyclase domain-containing protein [Candidatus Gastranaerophilales bacterium HUM_20]
MANLKTFIKSKTFFIYSVIFHIILSAFLIIVSWYAFEPKVYNFMAQNFSAYKTGSEEIAVIVIDDKSIERHRWPWKRDLYAKIFEYLNTYSSPKIIGYDAILSSSEDKASDKVLFDTLHGIDNVVVGFSPLEQKDADFEYIKKFNEKFGIDVTDNRKNNNFGIYHSISKFPAEYFNAVKYAGSVNINQDYDGYLRRYDSLITVDKNYYPSLALRMYMLLNNTNKVTLNHNNLFVDETNLTVPTDTSAAGVQNFIRYYKKHSGSEYTHKKYSAIDIIDSLESIKKGERPIIEPSELNDKIVFVGANARGAGLALEDALPTPILQRHPGVDIQATNLDNLINNEFIKQTTLKQDLFVIILLSIATFIIISKFSIFKSILLLISIGIIYFIFTIICYRNGIAPNVITPLAIQLVTMIFGYSYKFIQEGRNKEKIKNAMGKYLSQDIMQNVVQNIDDIRLGGKKANVTVLFADIRGFTSMSEKMTAEEVSVILNEYFSEIEPIITKYNGVINKFIGDAVMAIFGEPIQDINHPQNAVKCACEMLKKVEQLQDKWLFEGKPKIEIGIGINTGEAFVGNIGSEKRLEYTVIGDMVNLASRIESYNKVYKTNMLISSSTYSHVSDIVDVIKIADVTIRGKAKKMDIYEVLKLSDR